MIRRDRSRPSEREPTHGIDTADKIELGQWNRSPPARDDIAESTSDGMPEIPKQGRVFNGIDGHFIKAGVPAQGRCAEVEINRVAHPLSRIHEIVSRIA